MTWTLLIYTVPAQPSRLRAAVWREVKRVGATYLRDGVCALPEVVRNDGALQKVADAVRSLGGEATVVSGARIELEAADEVMTVSRATRSEEYAYLARDARAFLEYLRSEASHREPGRIEMTRLHRDLRKLRAWLTEAHSRDYFEAEGRDESEALLTAAERELAAVSEKSGVWRQTA